MPEAPLPPFLPSTPEEFAEHLKDHTPEWYDYCRQTYDYTRVVETTIAEANERTNQSDLRVQALEQEVEHWKEEIARSRQDYEHTVIKLQGIKQYQEEQLQKLEQKYITALREKDEALRMAVPMVNTPLSTLSPRPIAEKPADAPMGASTSTAPSSSNTPQLSERLPDPDKFEGDRKDLRRFISQIHEKMNVNLDRFPTPQSRMTYVTNRLKGPPYAQILPYIRKGICQLEDYDKILDVLDRAFGDPNRVNNARNELFRLRQTNKEFGTFFAEFQRLALEGEMPEETLSTLLEQAINRELRGMLVHNEPPTRDYHKFADFLQDLENRRRHYETPSIPAPRAYAAVAPKPPVQPTPIRPALAPMLRTERSPVHPDAMDLSTTRQARPSYQPLGRRERGECFRCGSDKHLVKDCPHPDNRPTRLRSMSQEEGGPMEGFYQTPAQQRLSPPVSPIRGRPRYLQSPSPDLSTKGVSLA
jgi:hypothetical protein